ncbi:uncharacterized protein RHOBADRAFT_51005 [Rhodotorula graminis WP1]|uniref:Oxidoreductase molybdopterin-binding domain-containing protein n=1 Tax=Rhodotorula graminis (strain WP1) TaxID=578459 RepID=A0A194SDM2_RHOGW|nr:uncharacterized protein RHOBADRAFT_51005 [Rhodotorula graminis WP1]KPV78550.1 hypothetical protein RHOBADRAFT_51005 [Rhodotorula graminis WP1]
MLDLDQRVLSDSPLNAEPSPAALVAHFLTPPAATFHRNHGPWLDLAPDYALDVSSDVPGLDTDPAHSSFTCAQLARFPKHSLVTVLACAGNRRQKMSLEKETEGLQWGKSALSNSHFAGALLRDVLAQAGIKLDDLDKDGKADKLHVHFESRQTCEEDSYYGASLPLRMALDPERPVLLAYEMNRAPLTKAHGAPLRIVVPGIIGARSVKWLERIIIRDKESDCFYQQRDYKILPPDATPATKEEHLKRLPALHEFPLNCEICDPVEDAVVERSSSSSPTVRVKGYSVGSKGVPIASVHVALVPLPVPHHDSPYAAATPELADCEVHQVRLHAATLPSEAWVEAELDDGPDASAGEEKEKKKQWGWTLFSAAVPLAALPADAREAALVAYATDANGERQELQTHWNLRGVAEASWSVVKIKFAHEE